MPTVPASGLQERTDGTVVNTSDVYQRGNVNTRMPLSYPFTRVHARMCLATDRKAPLVTTAGQVFNMLLVNTQKADKVVFVAQAKSADAAIVLKITTGGFDTNVKLTGVQDPTSGTGMYTFRYEVALPADSVRATYTEGAAAGTAYAAFMVTERVVL